MWHQGGESVQALSHVGHAAFWTFSPQTGVISGTAKTVIDRRTVTASFKGVILPGWLDCGCGDELPVRPFAAGTFYYSNRVNGFTTPVSASAAEQMIWAFGNARSSPVWSACLWVMRIFETCSGL